MVRLACWLAPRLCGVVGRTRLGLLTEDIENVVVETKELWVEVEVGLDRVIECATGVVIPGAVRVLHIRHMRRYNTFFGRTEVSIRRQVALEIATDLLRFTQLPGRTSPSPITRNWLGRGESGIDCARLAENKLRESGRCWRKRLGHNCGSPRLCKSANRPTHTDDDIYNCVCYCDRNSTDARSQGRE